MQPTGAHLCKHHGVVDHSRGLAECWDEAACGGTGGDQEILGSRELL